jgi:hypothetical protein
MIMEAGIHVRIFYGEVAGLYDAECVILDERVYRKWGEWDSEQGVAALLERLASRVGKAIWFDTIDGTGTTQFQFLPYVHKYLKLQVLPKVHGHRAASKKLRIQEYGMVRL